MAEPRRLGLDLLHCRSPARFVPRYDDNASALPRKRKDGGFPNA
jgi:hypothetical protein